MLQHSKFSIVASLAKTCIVQNALAYFVAASVMEKKSFVRFAARISIKVTGPFISMGVYSIANLSVDVTQNNEKQLP